MKIIPIVGLTVVAVAQLRMGIAEKVATKTI
jgi:hypothetical protein